MSKHLTLNERIIIKENLDKGVSISKIAKILSRSTSTISREITKNSTVVKKGAYGKPFNDCIHRKACNLYGVCGNSDIICDKKCSVCKMCNSSCSRYEKEYCTRLCNAPYVCNACPIIKNCTLEKFVYFPDKAHNSYKTLLSECRKGFNLTADELRQIDTVVSPLIKNGHSIYHISHHLRSQIPYSESTLLRLLNAGLLSAKNIDLPRKVRFKPRKGLKPQLKVDRKCTLNRKYEDYIDFIKSHNESAATQIDSVEGNKGGKVLLTAILPSINFMFAFIRNSNTAESVHNCFEYLYNLLPKDLYNKFFGILLADNGSEFSDPLKIEFSKTNERRSFMFYCHPSSPFEKPKVENNHEFLRRIIPKGTSLDFLTDEKVNLLLSHVNSYGRSQFNGLSPTDLFIQMFGTETLHLLGQQKIQPDKIILTPNLFKKEN